MRNDGMHEEAMCRPSQNNDRVHHPQPVQKTHTLMFELENGQQG